MLLQSLLDFVLSAQLPQLAVLVRDAFPAPQEEELRRRAWVKAARSELMRHGFTHRMWYFNKLELHPVKLNLTFRKPLAKVRRLVAACSLALTPS